MQPCAKCGYSHRGAGESPEHPVEISFGFGSILFVATIVLAVILTVILG